MNNLAAIQKREAAFEAGFRFLPALANPQNHSHPALSAQMKAPSNFPIQNKAILQRTLELDQANDGCAYIERDQYRPQIVDQATT
jgi:hypothetical protein